MGQIRVEARLFDEGSAFYRKAAITVRDGAEVLVRGRAFGEIRNDGTVHTDNANGFCSTLRSHPAWSHLSEQIKEAAMRVFQEATSP